jgi:hypothetical protein
MARSDPDRRVIDINQLDHISPNDVEATRQMLVVGTE